MTNEAKLHLLKQITTSGCPEDINTLATAYAILADADRQDRVADAQIKGGCFDVPACVRGDEDFPQEIG